jgi:UDP-glucose/galactose:(glucosyl)LPS alpha-1,2-glucosyl/galactosyltransferase
MYHVAFCFDRGYQQHFGAAIMSLLLNDEGPCSDLCVHVVTTEEDAPLRAGLNRLKTLFGIHYQIHIPAMADLQLIRGLPTATSMMSHVKHATYFRLFLPALLPESVTQVLYLDSDIIVQKSLRPLMAESLDGFALAAVTDLSAHHMKRHHRLPTYFNAGVLVMNLDLWRHEAIARQCLSYGLSNADRLPFADQCVLNLLLVERTKIVDSHWNAAVAPIPGLQVREDAAVLHFCTRHKPWQAWYEHPLGRLYWRYLDVSPWAGANSEQPTTLEHFQRMARIHQSSGRHAQACEWYARALQAMDHQKKS